MDVVLMSHPFTPRSLPSFMEWLSADYGTFQDNALTTPAVADGDVVGGWVDQSGVGKPATATLTKRPFLKLAANGIGGRAALLFDGVNDSLQTAAFTAALSQPNTVYLVFKYANANAQYALVDGIVAGSRHLFYNNTPAFTKYQIYAGTTVTETTGSINTSAHVAAVLFNGASSQLWVDNVSKVSGNAGANTLTGLTLGTAFDATSLPFPGLIAEVLIYNAAHSTQQRVNVQNYLAGKYGIVMS